MDGGAWKAAVHGVAEGQTWLSDFTFTFHFHVLEEEMATHSSVLAWRIPGTGEPGGLPSTGSHRVRHDWSDLAAEGYNSCSRGSPCPCTLHRQGLHKASSGATFMLNHHWGRAAKGKISLGSIHAELLWLCPTLCNPVDCGLPGFSAMGVLQARILERIGQYWLP